MGGWDPQEFVAFMIFHPRHRDIFIFVTLQDIETIHSPNFRSLPSYRAYADRWLALL